MNKVFLGLSLSTTLLLSNNADRLFDLSIEELMNIEVSTTSRYEEHISDSPANIFLFTKETIRERNYQNVLDILASLPSVDINKFSRALALDDISIRGISGNNKFLILLDGVRISSPAGSTLHVGQNFPVAFAKQVEVLFGAAGVVYGADAYAGVVNIITEKDSNNLELMASAGQDNYLNSFANYSHKFETFQLNAFISGYQSQDYHPDENYPAIYPTGTYNFAQTKDINFFTNINAKNYEVGINHFEHENSLDFSYKPATTSPATTSFDKNSKNIDRITTLYTKAKFDITSALHSNTTLAYSRFEKDSNSYFNNKFSGFDKGYKYAKTDKYGLYQDFTQRLDNHILSFGFSLEYYNIIPRGPDLEKPYDTSSSSTNQNQNYIGTTTPIDFKENTYNNYGIYIQDNYKVNNMLRLVAGVRFDSNTLYGDTFNPRASLIYKPSDKDIIKLIYSSAFLAPASDQVYNEFGDVTQKNTIKSFRHISNPGLKPEKLQTVEIDYEHFFTHNTHFKLSPFYTIIDDLVLNDISVRVNGPTTFKTQIFDNLGKSEIYGVEFSLDDTSKYNNFEFKSWFNLSYTNSQITKIDGSSTQTALIAPLKAKAGSTIIYNEDIFITPKLAYIGETASTQADTNGNKEMIDAYFLVDLNVQYKATKNLYITADIYNLLDARYYSAGAGGDTSVTFKAVPQPSRQAILGLYYKF